MNSKLCWLYNSKDYLYASKGLDLYEILFESISKNKINFIGFLNEVRTGSVYFPSEGFGYSLDENDIDQKIIDSVTFYLGEYISSQYIIEHPDDKDLVVNLLNRIATRFRISNQLFCIKSD